ncbi:ureidoglycolate lyase [Frigidibacter sp. MR17.14]|uniref:ureidoglycolate lyase n=1 Tax=Frigidibacter sp. MR17.14 TaxID=3126509 RepID=UPI003012E500
MTRSLTPRPLTPEAFAPFGEVLDASGQPDRIINAGLCGRFHDRARLDFGAETGGRAGISIFDAVPRALPYEFALVERHPEGSQAFLPMTMSPFLVIVARDEDGVPGRPVAFLTAPGQGINLHRGTWHGVLTPLAAPGLFAVVDRIGASPNLQEYSYDDSWTVLAP